MSSKTKGALNIKIPAQGPGSNRMVKLECRCQDKYVLRAARVHLAKGIPECPCCGRKMKLTDEGTK